MERIQNINGYRLSSLVAIFSDKNDYYVIEMKNLNSNLQTMGNCFESYALLIRSHHKNSKVMMQFDEDSYDTFSLRKNKIVDGNPRYNSLIYRIMKFKENYSWFDIDDNIKQECYELEKLMNSINLVMTKASTEYGYNDKKERILENELRVKYNYYTQLPIGVYADEKKEKNILSLTVKMT